MRYPFYSLACCLCLITFTITTEAQTPPNRTWVSATTGLNTNPCSRTHPCRDFSFAINAVAAGGEVVVLDSGGYGAAEITKSVQIIAPEGVHAAIAPSVGLSVPGVGVTAALVINDTAGKVVLRNLYVNKQGTTQYGIFAVAATSLHVEGCVVNGFSGSGVDFRANGLLTVRDTTLRHNDTGIYVSGPTGATAYASIDRCRLEDNVFVGVYAHNGSDVTVSNTVATGRRGASKGFYVLNNVTGETSVLNCESCVASNLFSGFRNDGGAGATMRVSHSTATGNESGFSLSVSGGTFESLVGTNTVRGNNTNRQGPITDVNPDAP